ncbi:MAG TPA: lipopolysaccharide heptosyltransferase II [Phycisphaerales bacterium]|nr:lipopolysaccharide heptosyltransferase II [Phycisphaerales bacterium]
MEQEKILVYLPSPLGDAILCTPALRSLRERFSEAWICFLAKGVVKDVLSPSDFADEWIEAPKKSVELIHTLRQHHFDKAILFKNSFGSAMITSLARIPERIGYARDGRGIFLTSKLHPQKNSDGTFKPVVMIDYYLEIAKHLECDISNRRLGLSVDAGDAEAIQQKLKTFLPSDGPIVILVPGGAFGPSKCWLSERFAKTADHIIERFGATVVVSVAPNEAEEKIAGDICRLSKNKVYNLAETPVSLGELKALFARAELVITNDTGPRHIAIALDRKVITLFGPNDPAWTRTGYENEIEITGHAACAPCAKPKCTEPSHLCMEAISVERVCEEAGKMLAG